MNAKTVSRMDLLTAAEIADMRLPGLPTTKANVIARAEREKWYFEERKGLGGVRRVYGIPSQYLAEQEDQTKTGKLLDEASQYVAEQRAAGNLDDGQLIQEVVKGVEMWLSVNNLQADPDRKAALIALLFRYFKEEGGIDKAKLDKLMRAVA